MPRPISFNRDEALDALMRTFWANGFEATSVDLLEQATGLNRQSLYNAFGDKEAMFRASLDRYRMKVGGPLRDQLQGCAPKEALRAYLVAHLRLLSDPEIPKGCLIATCSSELGTREGGLGDRMRIETAEGLLSGRNLFQSWAKDGLLSEDAGPEQLAALLATIIRGLAVLARAGAEPQVLEQAVAGALAAFSPFFR